MPAPLFPILLVTHIALAIGLFLPSLLLPFALRARRAAVESREPRSFAACSGCRPTARSPSGWGWPSPGRRSSRSSGSRLIEQPWLLVALAIYAFNLGLAFFIQRPNLRRLIGIRAADDDRMWQARARRQRYVSYAMAGLVGTIGFLMSTKPDLW